MPLYDYQCESCNAAITEFRPLVEYNLPVRCSCGGQATRRILPPRIAPDYAGYESPVTGRWIEGKRAHREELARTGCRVYEKGETREFMKRKADRQREYEQNVEKVVDHAIHDLGIS